jgi:carboxyl-terminal processing protease
MADWVRVEIGEGRAGFVAARAVKKAGGKPKLSGLDPSWQVTPPTVSVNVASYEVAGDKYTLKGSARDDTRVEDVYIFVSNQDAELENRKVFYKSNRGGKKSRELGFEAEIPIAPGSNLVTVIARENDQVKSAHTLYLYRTDGKALAAAP